MVNVNTSHGVSNPILFILCKLFNYILICLGKVHYISTILSLKNYPSLTSPLFPEVIITDP